MKKINVKSLAETNEISTAIAKFAFKGMVITLDGDLGAGKTTFTKAFGKELGIKKVINSPTFTIHKQYDGNFKLNHIDAYRLEGATQDLGFEDFYEEGITIIEWPAYIVEILPEEYLKIELEWINEDERNITITGYGEVYVNIEESI